MAASTSDSARPPNSTNETYDVFLSFRGEDTRRGFTSHLYDGFHDKHIRSYIDEAELQKGDEISSSLLRAVESSEISVVIFSENYASSSWCLDELVHVLRCREKNRQIVIPVFYRINPSHVRKQKGTYATAFAQLGEDRFSGRKDKMQVWRAALKVAAGLSGWDSSSIGYESELVQTIIQDILHKRIPSNLNISIYPLGYDVCHEYLSIFLRVGSNDVLLVGIAGEAKMGKTVIAKAIYDRLFQTFDGSSFLIDVGQKSKEPNGMVQLQEKLLFDILGEEMNITSVIRGVDVIRKRLCHKKVLIILDDVDDLPELFALVGSRKWFGLGSKIIITSRDSDLLRSFEVDQLFMANGLTLPLDIQEIWEPYWQSCRKIAGLKQYIQSFSYWTNDKVKYLEESLIRERRKGEIQKQIICELQHGKGEGHASHSCTSLEEVETSSGLKSEKKRLTSFSGCQGNNEIRNDGLKTMIQTAKFASCCTSSSDLKVPGCMLRPHNKGSITLDAPYKIANEVEQLKEQITLDKEVGLAVGTLGNTVAVGTIVDLGGLNFQIHGMPLGDENVCVAIVVPIQENVRLPIPVDDDLETVGHAVGSFVAWPKNLVQWPIRTVSKQKMYMEDLVSQSASPSLVQLEEMKHKQPVRDDESEIGELCEHLDVCAKLDL